jgi:hypothetical protein
MEWLEPWWYAPAAPEAATAYERELAAELGVEHPLYGVPLAALGKHDGSDDVLFRLLDESGRVVAVHLTWARHPEPPPWPAFEIFPSLTAFIEQRMRPDHTDFVTE